MKSFLTFGLALAALGLGINNASAQKEKDLCGVIKQCVARISDKGTTLWESAVNSQKKPICNFKADSYVSGARENVIDLPWNINPEFTGYKFITEVGNSASKSDLVKEGPIKHKAEYMIQVSLKKASGNVISTASYSLKTNYVHQLINLGGYQLEVVCSE
jgi:hypothetical protein